MKLNKKGFTLIEILVTLILISILIGIVIPNVIKSMSMGKKSAYNIMVSNIVTGCKELYEEVDNDMSTIYYYTDDGVRKEQTISITANEIDVNIQTLVSNGYLEGTTSNGKKTILNPITKNDIGACNIKIIKNVSSNYKITYEVKNNGGSACPSDDDYKNGVK